MMDRSAISQADYIFYDLYADLTQIHIHPKMAGSEGQYALSEAAYLADLDRDTAIRFASAMWLVDHASLFIRTVKDVASQAEVSLSDRPAHLSSALLHSVSNHLALPDDRRTQLVSRLLMNLGLSLGATDAEWEQHWENLMAAYGEQSALILEAKTYSRTILPWAWAIETAKGHLPLSERSNSLQRLLTSEKQYREYSEVVLNSWAYFLLLINRWKSATPLAIAAVERARMPFILDALGWAYFFEGDYQKSEELLTESMSATDPAVDKLAWSEAAFHKFYLQLFLGQRQQANNIMAEMLACAPMTDWTKKAVNLTPLVSVQFPLRGNADVRSKQTFDYDVAISFAGEERLYASELAKNLADRGVNVFYDEFEKATLWARISSHIYQTCTKIALASVSYFFPEIILLRNGHGWSGRRLRLGHSRANPSTFSRYGWTGQMFPEF